MSTMDIPSSTPNLSEHDQSSPQPRSSFRIEVRKKHVIDQNPDADSGIVDKKEAKSYIQMRMQGKDPTNKLFLQAIRNCSKIDVWPFVFGLPLLAGTAGISGALINHHFRKMLMLAEHGRVTSFIGLGLVPVTSTLLIHGSAVTTNILSNPDGCPICLQVRGGVSQVFVAVMYPFMLAPLLALPISKRLSKYSVPKLTPANLPLLVTYVRDLIRPGKSKFLGMLGLNLILGMGITYAEQYSYLKTVRPLIIKLQQEEAEKEARKVQSGSTYLIQS